MAEYITIALLITLFIIGAILYLKNSGGNDPYSPRDYYRDM